MAQYFSHLNGLTLGNNWGDLIRLLDKALVTGLALPNLVTVTQETDENIRLQFVANHKTMLFQLVELKGFLPEKYNSAFRVVGVPSATELILRVGTVVASDLPTVRGTAKIQSLGYEIIFRDAGDVKRVYRAKNPTAQHPFIRVDESTSSPDGTTGVYNSTYAKYAMVGLIENMTHIDDYSDTSKLQLPLDTSNFAKNWRITGTEESVVRGYGRWYWARAGNTLGTIRDSYGDTAGNRNFTIIGDLDAFYFLRPVDVSLYKLISGCGIFESCLKTDIVPPWFIMTTLTSNNAATDFNFISNIPSGGQPLVYAQNVARFFAPAFNGSTRLANTVFCEGVLPDYTSGNSNLYGSNNVSALQIPFKDQNNYLRGTLKHICYNGKNIGVLSVTKPILADNSMYVTDGVYVDGPGTIGSLMFYLGELE